MLILTQETGLDPFGEEFEKGIYISVPWSIYGTGPEDEEGEFMRVCDGHLLSHSFAPAIG
jgi:hypothetical protein